MSQRIIITRGYMASSNDDAEAAKRRKELREKLLKNEEVVVTQDGQVTGKEKQDPNKPAIVVPPGKLAASFYWYERNSALLQSEREAMSHFFPQFRLEKLNDGRLSWVGTLQPNHIRKGAIWYLQAIYDNNHPHNNSYGGSVKIYSIEPDLEELYRQLGSIPHVLRDSNGHLYMCTARSEDVKATSSISTSAASALSWAAKWITAFELWMAGDLSTSEFLGHRI